MDKFIKFEGSDGRININEVVAYWNIEDEIWSKKTVFKYKIIPSTEWECKIKFGIKFCMKNKEQITIWLGSEDNRIKALAEIDGYNLISTEEQ